jgi:DUF2939 family protein
VSNRIVINLDQGGQPAQRRAGSAGRKPRRRWLKVLGLLALFVVLAVVVACVGVFFWWRHYQSTPAYSVALLVDAAQRNDTDELARRVDDAEVAKNLVADVSAGAARRYGAAINPATQQRIEKTVASLVPSLQPTMRAEVAKQIKFFFSKYEEKPFIFLVFIVPSWMSITTEGDTAKAVTGAADQRIELTMRRDADRWKVVGYKDAYLVEHVVDGVMKDMPAIGTDDWNLPLFKKPGKPRKKQR